MVALILVQPTDVPLMGRVVVLEILQKVLLYDIDQLTVFELNFWRVYICIARVLAIFQSLFELLHLVAFLGEMH